MCIRDNARVQGHAGASRELETAHTSSIIIIDRARRTKLCRQSNAFVNSTQILAGIRVGCSSDCQVYTWSILHIGESTHGQPDTLASLHTVNSTYSLVCAYSILHIRIPADMQLYILPDVRVVDSAYCHVCAYSILRILHTVKSARLSILHNTNSTYRRFYTLSTLHIHSFLHISFLLIS